MTEYVKAVLSYLGIKKQPKHTLKSLTFKYITLILQINILHSGYHQAQVKRMFAAVSNRVLTLHREKIGETQRDVEEGLWRYLTEDEVISFVKYATE